MASITSSRLSSDIIEILRDADLSTISSKKIRKQLEEKYSTDLTSRKGEIDKICMDQIIKLTSEKAKKEKASTSSKSETSNGQTKKVKKSASDDDDDENSASDSSDDEPPVKKSNSPAKFDDEDLARKLQEEEEESGRRTRHGAKPPKVKSKRKKAKGSDESEDEEGGKKKKRKNTSRPNKYTEPCILSPQLAEIMGSTRLKRSDVVKRMWEIVKERNLYDPRNKQFMICDDQMRAIFGRKKVRIFGMMKDLKHHIHSPGDYEQMHG